MYGFSSAGEGSWTAPEVVWCLSIGGISLILFTIRQLVVKEPMLELRAFRYPMFALVTVLMLVIMMSMFSTMIMLPLFLQNVLLLTALGAGLVLMPGSIINGIMAPITGILFDKFGPRVLVIPGLALMALSIFLFMGIESTWSSGRIIMIHVIMMIGISMVMMPAQTTGLNQLPRQLYAHGTAILNTLQQVAGAIGVALFISVMSSGSKAYLATADLTNPAEGLQAMIAGLKDAFFLGLILALGALALGLFLTRTRAPKEDEDNPGAVQPALHNQ